MYSVDSPDAGSTLLAHLATFPPAARMRGSEYLRAGRVVKVTRMDETLVVGSVRGSQVYEVRLARPGPSWTNTCSCPMGADCKHVVAVAMQWLAQGRDSPDSAAALRTRFREKWEPVLAKKIGRLLSAEEGLLLGKLASLFQTFSVSGRVSPQDVRLLGFNTQAARRAGFPNIYAGWWEEPPKDPWELWQYIAHDLETSGMAVPEFLRSLTDTSAIRKWMGESERRTAVQRWRERFEQLARRAETAPISPSSLPEVPPLELRLRIGPRGWVVETRRHADDNWVAAPRGFVDRLVQNSGDELATLNAAPAVLVFLTFCLQHRQVHYELDFQFNGYGTPQLMHRVLSNRLTRGLVVDGAGRALEFVDTPLAWQVERSTRSARDYEIKLCLPDGRPLPPGALHLAGQPDYYFDGHRVYTGPPALDGASATGAIVPAEAVERPTTLKMLHRFGTKLPPEIAARFVTVPMRARLVCELAIHEFTANEMFSLRLHAVSEQAEATQEFSSSGWVTPSNTDKQLTTGKDGQILVFDLDMPNAVAALLPGFKLSYSEADRFWTRRATRSFADEFLAWRDTLPAHVEVMATGELASLLNATVRAQVDFSLLESSVHRDWFDLALALKPQDTTLTPEDIALLLKARGKLVRLPGKGWRRLQVEITEESATALESVGFDREALAEAALAGENQRFHALQLAGSSVASLLSDRQAETLRSRARAIVAPESVTVPSGLRAELRPYQREGFQFLAFLSANQLGGILADDMGLGKTVQTLAWLLWLAEARQAARSRGDTQVEPLRVLVVCPKSVVGNWESETARFAPALRVVRFSPNDADNLFAEAGDRPLIVVANYTQLRLAGDFFCAQRWHAAILDEAQFIKNPTAKVAQIARDLRAEHRVILTGTPIENRLLDLWSLFAFALPGLLGSQAAFRRQYADANPLALARLRSRVRHFLLRRTKSQVAADLPARTEEDVFVELEGEQRKLYDAELKRARAQLLKVETAKQFDKARFNILASLLRLRQICCHPGLIDRSQSETQSAKLDELLERVEELRDEGHQVLVFSQFVEMLELIRTRLVAADIEHLMLTGQTENRDELVKQFQEDKRQCVFLLSLKAAGFGLNLTAASYVILYDPWWNPAVEAQAIDRTHRIGQTVPVNAYRLIARGTIEEKIRALQREKSTLAGAIVQEESLARMLDLDSLREILS